MGRIAEAIRKAQADHQQYTGDSAGGPRQQRDQEWRANRQSRESDASEILAGKKVHVDDEQLREQRVIAVSDHDERVGPYRQLRTQILKTMRDNQWTTLAITSPNERAGKSVTAANLAISLAKDVSTIVLLVDLDLRTPSIHEKLNLNPDKGLVDFLRGDAALDEILFDLGLNGLVVLAGRSAGKHSSELLASPKMQDLMQGLCKQSESNITIFDLPPLLRNDDAILFSPYADATLLVVEDGVTTEEELQKSIHLLHKTNVIGTILNKAKV